MLGTRFRLVRLLLLVSIVSCDCAPPTNVDIAVEAPLRVSRDEVFTVVARITNTGSESQTLVSLDIADSYLEGIAITGSEPKFSESMHVPIVNVQSYTFEMPIAPAAEVIVRFHAVAVHVGDFAGDVGFSVNSESSFVSYPVRTIVE